MQPISQAAAYKCHCGWLSRGRYFAPRSFGRSLLSARTGEPWLYESKELCFGIQHVATSCGHIMSPCSHACMPDGLSSGQRMHTSTCLAWSTLCGIVTSNMSPTERLKMQPSRIEPVQQSKGAHAPAQSAHITMHAESPVCASMLPPINQALVSGCAGHTWFLVRCLAAQHMALCFVLCAQLDKYICRRSRITDPTHRTFSAALHPLMLRMVPCTRTTHSQCMHTCAGSCAKPMPHNCCCTPRSRALSSSVPAACEV